jgi:hypothetical protein
VDGSNAWIAVIGNPDRLVGYWTLDQHGYDGSGYGNDATGSVSYVSGKKKQAVLATSGFLTANPSSSLDDAFSGEEITISLWWKQGVNGESHSWWDTIYRGLHRIEHGPDSVPGWYGYWTGLYNLTNDAQSMSRNNIMEGNKWYHFTLMKNMTIMAVYVDGQLENSRSGDFYINPVPTDDLYLARHANDDHVDDVKIWNRALSESEIQGLAEDSIPAGQNAVIRFTTPMSKGQHKMRLCTRSMCTTGSLTII